VWPVAVRRNAFLRLKAPSQRRECRAVLMCHIRSIVCFLLLWQTIGQPYVSSWEPPGLIPQCTLLNSLRRLGVGAADTVLSMFTVLVEPLPSGPLGSFSLPISCYRFNVYQLNISVFGLSIVLCPLGTSVLLSITSFTCVIFLASNS
jgi:hypothetical protein